jgi:hypothetical protein
MCDQSPAIRDFVYMFHEYSVDLYDRHCMLHSGGHSKAYVQRLLCVFVRVTSPPGADPLLSKLLELRHNMAHVITNMQIYIQVSMC